jgi:histidine triad (HIT) family protein
MQNRMNCLFCDVVKGKQLAHLIYEDQTHLAIMDKYPIQQGHALVMPKEHHERILDMPVESVAALFSRIPIIARGILAATGADGFNVGQNNGRAANQIVPHVHVHVIPRYIATGNPWARRMIATDPELEELASKIRNFIKSG